MRSGCHIEVRRNERLHAPVAAGKCRECHRSRVEGHKGPEHAKGEMTTPEADQALCLRCHRTTARELAAKHVHRPAARVSCGFCHDPHGATRPKLLRVFPKIGPQKSFCALCHAKKKFRGKHIHKPLAKQACSKCHAAHGASNRALLRTQQDKLCFSCHRVDWRQRPQVHGPVAAGMCSACHDPHAADQRALLKQPPAKLCVSCHDRGDVDARHAAVKGFGKDCQRCHDSHAGQPNLLREKR